MSIEEKNNNIFSLNEEKDRYSPIWPNQDQTEEEFNLELFKRYKERLEMLNKKAERLNLKAESDNPDEIKEALDELSKTRLQILETDAIMQGIKEKLKNYGTDIDDKSRTYEEKDYIQLLQKLYTGMKIEPEMISGAEPTFSENDWQKIVDNADENIAKLKSKENSFDLTENDRDRVLKYFRARKEIASKAIEKIKKISD